MNWKATKMKWPWPDPGDMSLHSLKQKFFSGELSARAETRRVNLRITSLSYMMQALSLSER
jgi:hypothetical protein